MRLIRKIAMVSVVAVTLAMSACAQTGTIPGDAEPTPSVAESSTPSPTPSTAPVREQETGETAPEQLFGGECSNLISDEELSTMTGAQLTLDDSDGEWSHATGDYFIPQAGGVDCAWYNAKYSVGVYLTAVPAAAVDLPESSTCGGYLEFGPRSCDVDAVSNGVRFTGSYFTKKYMKSTSLEKVAAIESYVTATALALPSPAQAVVPADSTWTYPINCKKLPTQINFSTIFATTQPYIGFSAGGTDVYISRIQSAIWEDKGFPSCTIKRKAANLNKGFSFNFIGGARWAESDIAGRAGVTTMTYDGLDAVYVSPAVKNYVVIDIFDGVNWLSAGFFPSDQDIDRVLAASASVVAHLNGE
jgi:hypothetical protein